MDKKKEEKENIAFDPKRVELGKYFSKEEKRDQDGNIFHYRFFCPGQKEGEAYPLVIYLHGGGERGDDNEASLLALKGGTVFATEEHQKKHPCFILVPQCPTDKMHQSPEVEDMLMKVIQEKLQENPIDRYRIYVTGPSMGGMGTWHLISRYPKFFAAAMPICGAGCPYEIRAVGNMPIWAFHAIDDPVVPAAGKLHLESLEEIKGKEYYGTRLLVNSLRSIGNENIRYTEYPEGYMEKEWGLHPHWSWDPAYSDEEAITWLFAQTKMDQYAVNFIRPGFWHIDDYFDSSFYIVEGEEKALVIDTGMGRGDYMGLIRSLTKLPLELAITHAHGDHMYHADEFDHVYISEKEKEILPHFQKWMMADRVFDLDKFTVVKEEDVIDLGGVHFRVLELAGHTPGSLVFLDEKNGVIFTGDALGSGMGVWLQVPFGLKISEYGNNIKHFAEKIRKVEPLVFYGGHRYQEEGGFPVKRYNPLCKQLVDDMAILCDALLRGTIEGVSRPFFSRTGEEAFIASYGMADMVYTKSQLK